MACSGTALLFFLEGNNASGSKEYKPQNIKYCGAAGWTFNSRVNGLAVC
jgi:hypothetical protein